MATFAGSMVVVLRLLYKAWASIQDSATRIKPARASALLLVPIFNLYWMWRAFPGFAAEYNAFIGRNAVNVQREGRLLYILFTAMAWAATAAVLLPIWMVPAILMLVQLLVMIPLVVFALTGAINRLQNAPRSAQ